MNQFLRRWAGPLLSVAVMTQAGCFVLSPRETSYPLPLDAAPAIALGLQAQAAVEPANAPSPPVQAASAPTPANAGIRLATFVAPKPAATTNEGGPSRPALPAPREATEQPTTPGTPATSVAPSPFAGMKELTADALVARVLARNPSLAEMVSAWKVASARFPQVTSLDDPMLGLQAAPAAWFSREVDGGVRVEASQKFPWCGKLELRGENALALAAAAAYDVGDMQLQLTESARRAFYDYYLVDRSLAVNRENLRLLREFKKNAESRYATGSVSQQDVLQAEVEIGRAEERLITLERLRPVTVARIATLLHLPPDTPLPPPPEAVEVGGAIPDASQLRGWAVERRPDLRAIAERIRAEEAALGLAHKEFYPDVEVTAAYDTFWQERPLRGQVGVRLNLPVRKDRRHAAVAEAEARVAQRRAELARQIDQLNYQVQQAYEQVRESEQVVALYQKSILPAAGQNVQAARTAYATGKVPFLSLVEAQRGVVGLQDRSYEAQADYFRRRAALERVVGGPLAAPPPAPAAAAARQDKETDGRVDRR